MARNALRPERDRLVTLVGPELIQQSERLGERKDPKPVRKPGLPTSPPLRCLTVPEGDRRPGKTPSARSPAS